jgi:peptidoglycan-associated lipoprotein
MNKRQERALEVFLFVTFTIALAVGVGYSKSDTSFLLSGFGNMDESHVLSDFAQGAMQTDSREDIQLQSMISFASNDDKVNAVGRRALRKHAMVLMSNPHLILNIVGHADRRGSELLNQALGEKRAREVYAWLLAYGASQDQLIVEAYGESGPVKKEASAEENRCVELQYFGNLATDLKR